jgi:hypothetical protein
VYEIYKYGKAQEVNFERAAGSGCRVKIDAEVGERLVDVAREFGTSLTYEEYWFYLNEKFAEDKFREKDENGSNLGPFRVSQGTVYNFIVSTWRVVQERLTPLLTEDHVDARFAWAKGGNAADTVCGKVH